MLNFSNLGYLWDVFLIRFNILPRYEIIIVLRNCGISNMWIYGENIRSAWLVEWV